MRNETAPSAFDRLPNEDRARLESPQMRILIRGMKPAVYLGDDHPFLDVQGVRDALAGLGVDALVLKNFVVDRTQVAARLDAEPELADLVGWDRSRTIDENALRPETTAEAERRNHGLLAFVLGYPRSAIESFLRLSELRSAGIPTNPNDFFSQVGNEEIGRALTDDTARSILSRLRAIGRDAESTRIRAFERAESQADRQRANGEYLRTIRRYDDGVKDIYRRQWNLADEDIERLFSQKIVRLQTASGKDLYFFATSGPDAANLPDVAELERRLRRSGETITKVVT